MPKKRLFFFFFPLAKNTMWASPSFGLQFTISFYPHFVQNPDSCIGSQPLKPNVYKMTEMKTWVLWAQHSNSYYSKCGPQTSNTNMTDTKDVEVQTPCSAGTIPQVITRTLMTEKHCSYQILWEHWPALSWHAEVNRH